ncbi:hypothetical protein SELMODRAFT_428450 [Selaginella moellendorffii]|uniref:Uncharacterized protein n=1 Tax=Selaginella moellendorffii TaxID=88036 RepID=D8T2W2_SELML|nr:hypothetical protein SELMODRAFT_428450 [Selaginella moellendorffii]
MVAIIIGIWIHCMRRRSKVRDEVLVHYAGSGHHPGGQREYLIPLSKVENGLEHRPSQLNADPQIRKFLRPPRRLPPSALLGGACHDSGSGNKVAVNPLFRANPVPDQQKCWGNVVENCLIVSEQQRPISASLLQVDPLLRATDPDQQGSRENVVENPLIFSEPFSASLLQVDTLLPATDPYQQGNQGNMGKDPLIVSTPEEVHEQPRPFSASLLRLRHPEDPFSAAHFEPAGKNMAANELPVCPREGMEQSHGREQGGKVADPFFRSGIVFDPGDGAAAVQKQILKVMEMEMEKKIHMMEPRIKRFSHRARFSVDDVRHEPFRFPG